MIYQLVDTAKGHELLNFMDAYLGCNLIIMYGPDEERTIFVTDWRLYCYKVMSIGLKNVDVTYQRFVNKMFVGQLGKTMKIHINDMLVKSLWVESHLKYLKEQFNVLQKYRMKLNLLKCAFGVTFEKFIEFKVNQQSIDEKPDKIQSY